MTDKEEKDMVQITLDEKFIIDEESAQRLIKSSPVKVKETNIMHDINLKPKERMARAKDILESKRWKK